MTCMSLWWAGSQCLCRKWRHGLPHPQEVTTRLPVFLSMDTPSCSTPHPLLPSCIVQCHRECVLIQLSDWRFLPIVSAIASCHSAPTRVHAGKDNRFVRSKRLEWFSTALTYIVGCCPAPLALFLSRSVNWKVLSVVSCASSDLVIRRLSSCKSRLLDLYLQMCSSIINSMIRSLGMIQRMIFW